MLPQALVQNKIIGKPNTNDFELNWSAAAPILNTNFFHLERLVQESGQFRLLLRPWVETTDPVTGTELKLHEYYAALTNNSQYNIHVGDWVGRVRVSSQNDYLADCLVLSQPSEYYIYNDGTKQLELNTIPGIPCIIRPSLWCLDTIKSVSLNDSNIQKLGDRWQYTCHNTDIQFRGNSTSIPLAYTTDHVMGRIIYDNHLLAHVPVTILRKWNPALIAYEYALTFPDFDFPPTALVEFW